MEDARERRNEALARGREASIASRKSSAADYNAHLLRRFAEIVLQHEIESAPALARYLTMNAAGLFTPRTASEFFKKDVTRREWTTTQVMRVLRAGGITIFAELRPFALIQHRTNAEIIHSVTTTEMGEMVLMMHVYEGNLSLDKAGMSEERYQFLMNRLLANRKGIAALLLERYNWSIKAIRKHFGAKGRKRHSLDLMFPTSE